MSMKSSLPILLVLLSLMASSALSMRSNDPVQKFRQCLSRCETEEESDRQHRMCQQSCERQLEKQQGRPSYVEDDDDEDSLSPHSQDPQKKFRQCSRKCQTQELSGLQLRICEERCEQQLGRQEQRESYDDEDRDNKVHVRSQEAERKYEECKKKCEKDFPARGQEVESLFCRLKCQQEFKKQHG